MECASYAGGELMIDRLSEQGPSSAVEGSASPPHECTEATPRTCDRALLPAKPYLRERSQLWIAPCSSRLLLSVAADRAQAKIIKRMHDVLNIEVVKGGEGGLQSNI